MTLALAKFAQRRAIGGQFVRRDCLWVNACVFQQFAQQAKRRFTVAPTLDQHVQHHALIVHRTPQPALLPTDLHHHLVQAPATGWPRLPSAQVLGEQRAELDRPGAHSFPADFDSSLG
jgi:hypothetical protein